MSAAGRLERLNALTMSRHAEAVTYITAAGVPYLVRAVIDRAAGPILRDGMISVSEDHYQAGIRVRDLPFVPARNDRIIRSDWRRYRVYDVPVDDAGLWQMTLSPETED